MIRHTPLITSASLFLSTVIFMAHLCITAPMLHADSPPTSLTLLNVSYDPTRELYVALNAQFSEEWKKKTGQTLTINQSHGGSGKQARAVIEGLQADVVTLALANDIDVIAQKGHLLDEKWQSKLPFNSSPYTSTIVLLVRKGNPRQIKDWDDIVKPGVSIITPNPKTGGGSRWNYLAAWGYAQKKYGSKEAAREFVAKLYKNVAVLDSGARGSTTTFIERGIGDVFISWENEAKLAIKEAGKENGVDKYEIVVPSVSILAEPPVAVVEKNTNRKGSTAAAKAYLEFLYTPAAQEIIAQYFYRPRDPQILKKYENQFSKIELFTIDEFFGGWPKAQAEHFAEGAIYDQISLAK